MEDFNSCCVALEEQFGNFITMDVCAPKDISANEISICDRELDVVDMETEEQLDTPNEVLQLLNEQFQDRESLINTVREFVLGQGYAISIKKSKKNKIVKIGCDRGGTYRNRYNIPMENRKRRTASRLINCPFEVCGKRKFDGSWVLEIVNGSHNHEPSKDMSGHPSCRRFSKDEILHIQDLLKSGIPTRQILSSLRQNNDNIQAISKTVNNLRTKIRKEYLCGRTVAQALLEELGKGGFKYDCVCDSTSRLTRLFFAHPLSCVLTKSYSNVFVMDCTYKTNKYKMPLLEIVGVSSFNSSFCSCFCFLQKEEQEDYIWALKVFSNLLGDDCQPLVMVTDRELALMKAIQVVFPTTVNLLCVWHIEKNIVSRCKPHFKEEEDWSGFLSSWTALINSSSESEFEGSLQQFQHEHREKSIVLNYISATWLPFKEHFVSAWTDKYSHFGTRVSSRAEGAHAMIKKYLQVSTSDLCEVKNKICLAIKNQFQEIKTQLESEKVKIPHCFCIPFFKELVTRVSIFSLKAMWKQYELAISGDELLPCKSQFMTTMGLPCAHKMRDLRNEMLHLDNIHSQWRLDIRSFVDNDQVQSTEEGQLKGLLEELQQKYQEWPLDKQEATRNQIFELVNESVPLVYEPNIISHRGRPPCSKTKRGTTSTKRNPSAFEITENTRKCRLCKGFGHNSRTCRSKNEYFRQSSHNEIPSFNLRDETLDMIDLNAISNSTDDFLWG